MLGSAVYGGTVLADWVIAGDSFRISDIRVLGAREVSELDILEAARVETGANVFNVSAEEVERSVSSLPEVKCCVVQKKLPDELIIRVAERRPYFLVNCGCLWRADREGVLLGLARSGDIDSMIVAGWHDAGPVEEVGSGDGAPAPGAVLERGKTRRVVKTIAMVRELAPELCGVISEVSITRAGDLELFAGDPSVRVLAGAEGPQAEDLLALGAVMDDLRRRGLSEMEIDMRFDRQLVARQCGSGSAKSDVR